MGLLSRKAFQAPPKRSLGRDLFTGLVDRDRRSRGNVFYVKSLAEWLPDFKPLSELKQLPQISLNVGLRSRLP